MDDISIELKAGKQTAEEANNNKKGGGGGGGGGGGNNGGKEELRTNLKGGWDGEANELNG